MQAWFVTLFALIALLLVGFGAGKVALSVTMEYKRRPEHPDKVYIAYCSLETLHILFDIILLMTLLFVLLEIRTIWKYDPEHTNQDSNQSVGNKSTKELLQLALKKELIEYHERGEKVKYLMYPFTVWFLTPWIVFLFSSSINPHYFLAPWTDSDSDIEIHSRAYYLVNIFMKIFQLLLQYTFALKVNQYHRDYYMALKRRVIFKDEDKNSTKSEYYAEACQLMDSIEFHDDFNFYPTFLSINPRIDVEGPFYTVYLLLTVFLNISDQLLHIDPSCTNDAVKSI